MANEFRIAGRVQYKDPSKKIDKTLLLINNLMRTRNTTLMIEGILDLTTTPEAIPLGDVTQPGWAVFLNLDSDLESGLFVQIGFDISSVFRPAKKLSPGMFSIDELEPTQTWKAQMTSSTGQLLYGIFQRNSA